MSEINDWIQKNLFDDKTCIRYLESYLKTRASQKAAMQRYYQKNRAKLDAKHVIYRKRITEERKTSLLLPK